jgi:hypothetical protein
MKRQFPLLLLLLLTEGCGQADHSPVVPPYPTTPYAAIRLSQTTSDSGESATTTHSYQFEAGRVTALETRQQSGFAQVPDQVSTTTVTYGEGTATVDDHHGTTAVYTLNPRGYATGCELTDGTTLRRYTFRYFEAPNNQFYLRELTETIDGRQTAFVSFDYADLPRITFRWTMNDFTAHYTADADRQTVNHWDIPCLFVAERYPLDLHRTALYGKLLGDPLPFPITRITPQGTDESVSYAYTVDAQGILRRCNEQIRSYGRIYARTVDYFIQ